MKKMILLFSVFIGSISNAMDMICTIDETKAGAVVIYEVVLPVTTNTHGDYKFFYLQTFPKTSMLLSYLNGVAVIHFNDESSGISATSHSDMTGVGHAYAQLILPNTGNVMDSVVVNCDLSNSL